MRKGLIVAIALAIAVIMMVSTVNAQAVKGYGPIMGGMWGCGLGCGINGYGLGIFGGLNQGFPFAGRGQAGFAGYGIGLPFNSFGPGFPFAGCGI
jgi:hypothetical protein